MQNLADAGFAGFKISVVMTRHNVAQLDEFKAIADRFGAQLRITRLRPSGRGADVWDELHPTAAQQRELYDWLLAHGENVLTGDSFFHLAGYGQGLPGLNMCGAGRVVCLIDPVGDVYACPFAIHDAFLAGNVRGDGRVRRRCGGTPSCSPACGSRSQAAPARPARPYDACQGGCMAAKFFTGLPLDGPDPECVRGFGETALAPADRPAAAPRPSGDHSHRRAPAGRPAAGSRCRSPSARARPGLGRVRVRRARPRPRQRDVPDRACDQSPLAGFAAQPRQRVTA